MANVRTIYFSDEVYKNLKDVQNVSGLISTLLKKHFEKNSFDIETWPLEKVSRTINELKSSMNKEMTLGNIEKTESTLKILEERKKELLETAEEKKNKEEKNKGKRIESVKGWINEFTGITDERELQEIAELYETEKGDKSLIEWLKEKKIEIIKTEDEIQSS